MCERPEAYIERKMFYPAADLPSGRGGAHPNFNVRTFKVPLVQELNKQLKPYLGGGAVELELEELACCAREEHKMNQSETPPLRP